MGDCGNKALVTLDGTDMPVQMKFSEKFMSHKFKGNGLKYEVGVCIVTGRIVLIHGPSRAGESDITLARQAFVSFWMMMRWLLRILGIEENRVR